LFDYYRPVDIQKNVQIVSDPKYVADPAKDPSTIEGSRDILVDQQGNELDMGTSFDYFGNEASHNYINYLIRSNQTDFF
jgi:D-alanyl-D-alanine dipeptidase